LIDIDIDADVAFFDTLFIDTIIDTSPFSPLIAFAITLLG